MKKIRINLDRITDFEIKLAQNPSVIASLDEIIALPLQERARKLQEIQQKIQHGNASLFEEKVLAKLYEARTAEWIKVIHKNLPVIEQEREKRKPPQAASPPLSPTAQKPPSPPPADKYPSELLEFLATQKPPSPPDSSKPSSRSERIEQPATEATFALSVKDFVVAGLFLILLTGGIWYARSTSEVAPPPQTFNQQARNKTGETPYPTEQQQKVRTQFETAAQHLRTGPVEEGEAQLLAFLKAHPDSPYAEDAYLLLAETARQRQNDPEKALAYYQEFLEQYPESQHRGLVRLKMGFTYEEQGDTANAREMYRLLLHQKGTYSRLGQLASDRLSSLQNPEKN